MEDIKLLGSRIIKLSGERNPDFAGKLSISTNVKILAIEKVKDAKEGLEIRYELMVDYADLGKIVLEGNVYISTSSKNIKEILKAWNDKKFDTEELMSITNLIIRKASIKAFTLEEELGLPIHIQLPSLSVKK